MTVPMVVGCHTVPPCSEEVIDAMGIKIQEGDRLLTELLAQEDRGENPDWERLRNFPGTRLEDASWEETRALIQEGTVYSLAKLGRTPHGTRIYRNFRDNTILKNYASVTDYLFATIFDVDCKVNSNGKRIAVVPSDFNARQLLVWRENDFPYALEEGVHHNVLWSSSPLSSDELIAQVHLRLSSEWDWIYFVNPTVLKSVPAIWHAHVLFRKRESAQ